MRSCDFCGSFRPLTIESKETARVICSRCVWSCADKLVENGKRYLGNDPLAMGEGPERLLTAAEDEGE